VSGALRWGNRFTGLTQPVRGGQVPCLAPPPCTSPVSPLSSSSRLGCCRDAAPHRLTSASAPGWSCSFTNSPASPTSPLARPSIFTPTPSVSGGSVGPRGSSISRINPAGGASPPFPPLDRAQVSALACERVALTQSPLSRQSHGDLARRASALLGKPISRRTIGRILEEDALKPWQYEYWIFPRAADFFDRASVVLDLYEGRWHRERLGLSDHIISADEKTSIQARVRCHATLPPGPDHCRRVEHEYQRGGALQYLAAWDVQVGRVMGRCEAKTGIEPFGRLVAQVMSQEPYRRAERVFWVVDNGSSHRGEAAVQRLLSWYGNAILVHTPVHASWLNQVEIYFSMVQRKVLTPNDFADLAEVEMRLRLYEELTNSQPRPFDWKFTKAGLADLLLRLAEKEQQRKLGSDAEPYSCFRP
jgi:DDE superfamily endonuclease